MNGSPALTVLIIVAIIALIVIAGYASAARTRGLRAFATAHGLTFAGSDWEYGDRGFPLFMRSGRKRWTHVLRGTWKGIDVTYADYQYTVQEGRNSQTFRFSTAFTSTGLLTPQVEIA